jgi:penicillin-binding protein 1A
LVLDGGDSGEWRPQNYTNEIYGPSTLRRGIEESRNLMTIRLARDIGINNVIDRSKDYGLNASNLNRNDLSTALGTASLSLISMTSAYSVFANNGSRAKPYYLEGIQDVTGRQIFRGHQGCEDCEGIGATPGKKPRPVVLNVQQVISPTVAYQMLELLRGVVLRGTGARAQAVGHPTGGKTGTTNDYIDAWFIGFSANLVTGVWIGFDTPTTLGHAETGGRAAAPIWTEFMKNALKNARNMDFDVPPGITFVTVDAETGELPSSASTDTILEAFPQGKEPTTVRSSFGSFSNDPSDPGNGWLVVAASRSSGASSLGQ